MTDFAIIGAGISGLATAWYLRQEGFSVRVLEAAPEVGGSIRSVEDEGLLIEQGPNSTLENNDALPELIRGVGAEAKLQEANQAAKKRFILKDGAPVALPAGPPGFLTTPLFSLRGKLRIFAEPFIGRARCEQRNHCEETVAQFVRRRLGREMLDWAVDPFISGVYAGDPEKLSIQAATAKIYALEKEYGSLIVGAIRRMIAGKRSGPAPGGRLVSFEGGMQTLPRSIAAALGDAVSTGTAVQALEKTEAGWTVRMDGGESVEARQVVLAVPADRAAALIAPLVPHVAAELRDIEYPAVASVAMAFPRGQVGHPLDGFGFLIPRRLGVDTLGTLFSSTLFPGRAPKGQVLLTSFIGGARNPGIRDMDEAAIAERVLNDIKPPLKILGAPETWRLTFWDKAIPQYTVGHLARLGRIDHGLRELTGLHTRANWRDGISVSDCVKNGRAFAQRMRQGGGG